MDHCKFCQAPLPEDSTVCPSCGRDNAQTEEKTEETVCPEQNVSEQMEQTAQNVAAPSAEQTEYEDSQEEQTSQTENTQEGACVQETENSENKDASESLSAPIQEGIQATPMRIALTAAAVVVLAGLLIAWIVASVQGGKKDAVSSESTADPNASATITPIEPVETTEATIPADGNPDDVTCKGSYSVDDETAKSTAGEVVATVGGLQLTNSQLQVFYWMEVQGFWSSYASYSSYFGLDFSKPLDTQVSMEEDQKTWQQYFLQCALNNWHQMQAMALEGEKQGTQMAPENQTVLDNLDQTVEEMAKSYGVTTEQLLANNFGPGAQMADYRNFQELYFRGLPYFELETAKIVPEENVLREYFESHKEDYASGGVTEDDMYVDVRHILVTVEGGETAEDGTVTHTEEEWEACRAKAQGILDEYLAGDRTEESFAALATEKSEDPGSQAAGGLYQQVYPGQMVEAFNDWCFDSSRKSGDYGLVQTNYGYHVMYFVSSEPQWRYYAQQDWTREQTNAMIDRLLEGYPMEVDYSKITLGTVDFGA